MLKSAAAEQIEHSEELPGSGLFTQFCKIYVEIGRINAGTGNVGSDTAKYQDSGRE